MEKSTKIVLAIGTVVVLAGIGLGLSFILKKPKPTGVGDSQDSDVPSPASDKADAPKGDNDIDYSVMTFSAKSPAIKNGFSLGQAVTVKSGSTVTRMDKYLDKKGDVKLNVNTNFGTLFALNPSSVIIKQNKRFSYPFYQATYNDLKKDTIASVGNNFGEAFSPTA